MEIWSQLKYQNELKASPMPNTPKLSHDVDMRYAEFCSDWDVKTDGDIQFRISVAEFIAQELSTLKAQVRKEIEEQITKMENSNWLHGMGLSGSQAEYIEANIKASYLSIASLKGEE